MMGGGGGDPALDIVPGFLVYKLEYIFLRKVPFLFK